MRIAHIVTYDSPEGAFGGPVSVAFAQAQALAERGHAVTVYAGSPREHAGTQEIDGFTLRTFPAFRLVRRGGFASMVAPALSRRLASDIRRYDIAHVHLARDLVTIPAALRVRAAGLPYVVQPHGMIDRTDRALARPLDALATKPLLRRAERVLTLTSREASEILAVEARARTHMISNGVRIATAPMYDSRDDVVLFLARLASRKRPLAFVEMARALRDALPQTRFVLGGPDEGEGAAIRDAIAASDMADRIEWIGPVSPRETDRLLASARVYVLPSFGEVFPMTVLEAFRAGTPVVATNSLGIAADCERYGAAVVTDGTPRSLADAVRRVYASDSVADGLRAGGERYLRECLDVRDVAVQLEAIYLDARTHA